MKISQKTKKIKRNGMNTWNKRRWSYAVVTAQKGETWAAQGNDGRKNLRRQGQRLSVRRWLRKKKRRRNIAPIYGIFFAEYW
jgi:hypothetical protein